VSEPPQDEAEVLDGLPVLSDEQPSSVAAPARNSRALSVALASPVQAAAAAAGGFLAGAAVVGLVHRRQAKHWQGALATRRPRRLRRAEQPSRGPVGELVQVVASRSLLVDVHLLGSPGGER
jgi:hypothetical protein